MPTTKIGRTMVVATSATAISAIGLLIGLAPAQALAMPLTPPPKPVPCDQYAWHGDVNIRQSELDHLAWVWGAIEH